jgi:RNA polymerase sigma-70 factor (ECF subfamily)
MGDDILSLTEAAGAGDRVALDRLIECYLPQLRAFVRLRAGAMVRARESSSDLVQSVCREVLEHMDRFRYPSEAAFKQWLFATALRKIQHRQEYYLAQKRDVGRETPMQQPDSNADLGLLEVYASFSTPSRRASHKEEMERIEAAFDQISDEQREVITMAHLLGLSRAEIAERIGKSEGAVRVLLHRALARLSGLLEPPAEPEPGSVAGPGPRDRR